MRASKHPDELRRLAALRAYGILDSPRESDFDEIVALAAEICETPISVVNLIDDGRQWFKAEVGLGVRETPLETSICAHAILQRGIVEVPDTAQDDRFRDNPLVKGNPGLRFYAGALLETEDGLPLGTLCVLDTEPRTLTERQRNALRVLGHQVMRQLEFRRQLSELRIAQTALSRADIQLQEDRDFIRLVTDRLPVRLAYVDHEYRYRFVNDAYERQFGISADNIVGRQISEVMGDEIFRIGRPLIDRAFSGETFSVELELPYDDSAQWVQATYVPDFAPNGEVRGVVAHVLDVTDQVVARKEIERLADELGRQGALWDSALSNVSDLLFVFDRDVRFQFANRALLNLYGLALEDVFGRTCEELNYPPEVARQVREDVGKVFETGVAVENAVRYISPTGYSGFFEYVFAPIFSPGGGVEAVAGSSRDVAARNAAQEAVRLSEERLADLADSIDQLVWTADSAGDIGWYNRRWYEYTGATPEEMQDSGWKKVHDPAVLPFVVKRWTECVSSGTPFEMEFPIRGADGIFRPFLTRANPIMDSEGKVRRWFGTNTNIQSRKDAEAELERRVQERTLELTRANRDLNEFSYSVAHDLRAPLRAIAATSRILIEDSGDRLSSEDREHLDRQERSAVRLAAIVDDLLAFARLAKSEMAKEKVDLTGLCKAAISETASPNVSKPCAFNVQEGMITLGDRKLLGYAIANLIDNACKFSPEGGMVTVGIRGDTFFVSDEGIGFDMTYAHKLFVAFERLVDQERYEGTGVGLANVKRIIERHGGKIWAESELGKGATFFFTLEPPTE